MRHTLLALLVSTPFVWALPAMAQEMTPLDESLALPGDIQAVLDASLATDQLLDRVRRWEGDLTGDGAADQLVQAAVAVQGGGNAVTLRHWLFAAEGNGFSPMKGLDLPHGVIAATRIAGALELRVYKALDSDPSCCPSSEETLTIPLP